MFLGDQLADDVLDWRPDFEKGRITYPHTKVMEREALSVEAFRALSVEDLRALMEKEGLELSLFDEATAVYESGQSRLRESGHPGSRLDRMMLERVRRVEGIRRRQKAGSILRSVSMRLRNSAGEDRRDAVRAACAHQGTVNDVGDLVIGEEPLYA